MNNVLPQDTFSIGLEESPLNITIPNSEFLKAIELVLKLSNALNSYTFKVGEDIDIGRLNYNLGITSKDISKAEDWISRNLHNAFVSINPNIEFEVDLSLLENCPETQRSSI